MHAASPSLALRAKLVEAAGIEPASEKVRTGASTRLAGSFFYLTGCLLSGKQASGQPLSFARPSEASRSNYPEFASPGRIAPGRLSGRRHGLSREGVVGVASYFSVHRINEEVTLGVLLSPLPFRRNQIAPVEPGRRTRRRRSARMIAAGPARGAPLAWRLSGERRGGSPANRAATQRRRRPRVSRSMSRRASRSLSACRLSCAFLPRAIATSTFAQGPWK